MQYTAIINDHSYDLPKKTVAIAEEMDRIIRNDSVRGIPLRNKFQAAYTFVKQIIGAENARDVFGTDNFEDMDMSEVTIAFKTIYDAYQKPVNDYAAEQARHSFDSIPVDKLARLSEASAKIASMTASSDAKRNL